MITVANAELDSRILRVIDTGGGGGTAYFIAGTLDAPRDKVKDRLASLRRRGVVQCRGAYWTRKRESA